MAKEKEIWWQISVFANETLAFVKDTRKTDREQDIIKRWEENQPGRAVKAALSRELFLLKKRKAAGEKLTTEEEEKLIGRPKIEEPVKEDKEKNKRKKSNTVEVLESVPKINEEKQLPKKDDHTSRNVREFLDYCQRDRLIELSHLSPSESKIVISNFER